jgi:hypothetical protein
MYGVAGLSGLASDTNGSKVVTVYSTGQVVETSNGTSYTTSTYPAGLLYQTTVNSVNFASYYGAPTVYVSGQQSTTYTSSTFANYPTGFTKITAVGFGSPVYNSDDASLNLGLITYTDSKYLFSISSLAYGSPSLGITSSTDLLNFSQVFGGSVGSLNGVTYFSSTSSSLSLTTNSSGQIVFVVPASPDLGAYLANTSALAVQTTLTAGIVEIS